jgi:hypothetical protein
MMDDKRKKRSAWQRLTSFPQSFSYVVDAPLEDVIQNIADLEQEHRPFGRDSQEVSILPRRDHYAFRLRRRRHGTLAASAEGEVWENEAGRVVVEGEARSNGGTMILVLIALFIPVLVFTMAFRHVFSIFPMILFLVAVVVDFMLLLRSRQNMITQIGSSISYLNGASGLIRKSKRQPEARLALEDETASDDRDGRAAQEIDNNQREQHGR